MTTATGTVNVTPSMTLTEPRRARRLSLTDADKHRQTLAQNPCVPIDVHRGVRVAYADVNGDGTPDIIAATGPALRARCASSTVSPITASPVLSVRPELSGRPGRRRGLRRRRRRRGHRGGQRVGSRQGLQRCRRLLAGQLPGPRRRPAFRRGTDCRSPTPIRTDWRRDRHRTQRLDAQGRPRPERGRARSRPRSRPTPGTPKFAATLNPNGFLSGALRFANRAQFLRQAIR